MVVPQEDGSKTPWNLLKIEHESITNLCGYASYYLAEQWDYDALENKELLLLIYIQTINLNWIKVNFKILF